MKLLHFFLAASLAFTALIAAIAAPLIVSLTATAAARAEVVLPQLPLFIIEHRFFLPALALPGLASGIITFARRRFSPLLFALGCLALFVLLGVTIATFIAILAPLYEYQAL